jgi:hypothetical protein
MKKVISYSLWGSSPQYTINLIKNLDLAKQFFEGWTCRVHLSPNVPQNIVNFINSRDNSEIVLMGEDEGWNGMFWRFYPASDPTVDIMISRDCDSYLNIRDKAAVDEWIASKKMFHIMRDHRSHSAKIMGGMWGAMQGAVPNMKSLIDNYSRKETNNRKNIDQEFLKEVIYPLVKNNSLVHDFMDRFGEGAKKFPIPRKEPMREFIQNDILMYLNATTKEQRSQEYKKYDNYDNDYIGRIESVSDEDINFYKDNT